MRQIEKIFTSLGLGINYSLFQRTVKILLITSKRFMKKLKRKMNSRAATMIWLI